MRWIAFLLLFFDTSPRDTLKPGLLGEYFDIGRPSADFPDFAKLRPTLTRVDANLDFEGTQECWKGTKLRDYFAVRWTGFIDIPTTGTWTIGCDSDDGSRVTLDDKLLVENGGLHAMREATGNVDLRKGAHKIRVEFFENEVFAGIRLSWGLKSKPLLIVPPEALRHAAR